MAIAIHGVGRFVTSGPVDAGMALGGVQKADVTFAPVSVTETKQWLELVILSSV